MPILDTDWDTGTVDISFDFQLINQTAWETAKITGAISHIEIEKLTNISMVYQAQDYYQVMVKDFLTKYMYIDLNADLSSNQYDILSMQNFMRSMLPIEQNLLDIYTYILDEVLNSDT